MKSSGIATRIVASDKMQESSTQTRFDDVLARPPSLLRLEGLVVLVTAVTLYFQLGGSWWLFALLLFVPDLSMLGYTAGPRVGAATYNVMHTSAVPLALALFFWLAGPTTLLLVSLIWLAHVGLDRLLGYGLKLPTAFKDTHLGRIGGRAP